MLRSTLGNTSFAAAATVTSEVSLFPPLATVPRESTVAVAGVRLDHDTCAPGSGLEAKSNTDTRNRSGIPNGTRGKSGRMKM